MGIFLMLLMIASCDRDNGPTKPKTSDELTPWAEMNGASNSAQDDVQAAGCCYGILSNRWPYVSGTKWVTMTLSSKYASFDPGWKSIANNSALAAMGQWHWTSNANIGFYYHTTLTSINSITYDGYNVIGARYWDGPGKILAVAGAWINSRTGKVMEVDIIVDTADPWGVLGESNKFDLWSVMTHELGHVWRLADLYSSSCYWESMYGYGSKGKTYQRTLYCGDKQGVQTLYGYKVRTAAAQYAGNGASEPPRPIAVVSNEE